MEEREPERGKEREIGPRSRSWAPCTGPAKSTPILLRSLPPSGLSRGSDPLLEESFLGSLTASPVQCLEKQRQMAREDPPSLPKALEEGTQCPPLLCLPGVGTGTGSENVTSKGWATSLSLYSIGCPPPLPPPIRAAGRREEAGLPDVCKGACAPKDTRDPLTEWCTDTMLVHYENTHNPKESCERKHASVQEQKFY